MAFLPEHRQIRFPTPFVACYICACPERFVKRILSDSVRKGGRAREIAGSFLTECLLLSGTPFTHRPRYDIAKLAFTWPGVADAGSAAAMSTPRRSLSRYGLNGRYPEPGAFGGTNLCLSPPYDHPAGNDVKQR